MNSISIMDLKNIPESWFDELSLDEAKKVYGKYFSSEEYIEFLKQKE